MTIKFSMLDRGDIFRLKNDPQRTIFMRTYDGLRDNGGPINAIVLVGVAKGNPESVLDDADVELFQGGVYERSHALEPVEE